MTKIHKRERYSAALKGEKTLQQIASENRRKNGKWKVLLPHI